MEETQMAVKQTAGRRDLGDFAPKFAQLNDDVLFGEVWSREEKLSLRDRSLVTVVSLMAQGLTDSSFQYHLMTAKKNGITKEEIAEILTQAAFYAGWPKAWAAFRMAKKIWGEETAADAASGGLFGLGEPNDAYAQYFIGKSYLKMLKMCIRDRDHSIWMNWPYTLTSLKSSIRQRGRWISISFYPNPTVPQVNIQTQICVRLLNQGNTSALHWKDSMCLDPTPAVTVSSHIRWKGSAASPMAL